MRGWQWVRVQVGDDRGVELGLLYAVDGGIVGQAGVEPRRAFSGRGGASVRGGHALTVSLAPFFFFLACVHQVHGVDEVLHGHRLLLCGEVRM